MEPVRDYSVLVDLLDHALQKGLYLSADVIISVADVPLIGLNLRLALASIQTMLNYGLMRDWDEAHRSMVQEKRLLGRNLQGRSLQERGLQENSHKDNPMEDGGVTNGED